MEREETMKRQLCATVVAELLWAVNPLAVVAAESSDAWQFDLAPFYLWATTVSGEVGMGPATGEIEADFGDITENLEGVFSAHFEARKGAWGGSSTWSTWTSAPAPTFPAAGGLTGASRAPSSR